MRRIPRSLLALAVALVVTAATGPAAGEELPPGFVDGQPVGAEPTGTDLAPTAVAPPADAAPAAAIERYFGSGAYTAVRNAVAASAHPCPISDDGLTALVLAPVFAESSAATSASTAPSPMTLSRYDEWTGTFSDTNNADANYGLYAFRNPHTAYSRAYWHPGIGIWQYDSAGLGAPLTTVESMDVRVVAGEVAEEVSSRYCAAMGTDAQRRDAAWAPWAGCDLVVDGVKACERFFGEMYNTTPKFANLNLVAGIGPLGGTVERTCILDGVAGTLPCWYVEPRVGVIQGSTAWATLSPSGGSGPTVAPAPLSHPFYVVDRGATEERHWLRVDTAYSIDIGASRAIGKNARPRSNQPGSGLTWSSSSSLCDLTTGRGACVPIAPTGVSSRHISVSSGYRPVSLDADGDAQGDVLWYRPGSGSDALWLGLGGGTFASQPVSANTSYDDVLTGDVDGDGDDDVLWYARSSGTSFLWRSNGVGGFSSIPLSPGAGRRPMLLDTNGDGDDEVFWYGPGSLTDSQWSWNGSGFSTSSRPVSGSYTPIVGDFDANGREDIFWYAPGSGSDFLWLHTLNGSAVTFPKKVSGSFVPVVGDLDGDGRDDIFWYAPGSPGDYVWFGEPAGAFSSVAQAVSGTYVPIVADVVGSGRDSVFWYLPGVGADFEHRWSTTRVRTSAPRILPGRHTALVGAFATGGGDGILWYEPNLPTDLIWYR